MVRSGSPTVKKEAILDPSRFTFDEQAGAFDGRAGLPPEVGDAVAREVERRLGARRGGALLDVGAGTGEFGIRFLEREIPVVAIDLSEPMLRTFRDKVGALSPGSADGPLALLVVADAERFWPIREGTVRALFFARSVHLLRAPHVARETLRVGARGGFEVILGRLKRPPTNLRSEMRREMRRLLESRGIRGKNGEQGVRRVIEGLEEAGAVIERRETIEACRWTVSPSPAIALEAWRGKEGLAGHPVPEATKAEVLEELARWASTRWGGLDTAVGSEESFELTVLSLRRG